LALSGPSSLGDGLAKPFGGTRSSSGRSRACGRAGFGALSAKTKSIALLSSIIIVELPSSGGILVARIVALLVIDPAALGPIFALKSSKAERFLGNRVSFAVTRLLAAL